MYLPLKDAIQYVKNRHKGRNRPDVPGQRRLPGCDYAAMILAFWFTFFVGFYFGYWFRYAFA